MVAAARQAEVSAVMRSEESDVMLRVHMMKPANQNQTRPGPHRNTRLLMFSTADTETRLIHWFCYNIEL